MPPTASGPSDRAKPHMLRLKSFALTSLTLGCAAAVAATFTGVLPFTPFGLSQEMEGEKPGKEHEVLLKAVGEWTGVIKMTMPGAEGEDMKATETITSIGDFWTTSDFHSDFMGFQFSGRAVLGYDAKAKKMVGTWCDSSSSYLAVMDGEVDTEAGTVTMHWTQPLMGEGDAVPHSSVTTTTDDHYVSKFSAELGGKAMPIMEIHMDRVKK